MQKQIRSRVHGPQSEANPSCGSISDTVLCYRKGEIGYLSPDILA